jgi:hypothetical protein
MDSHKRMALFIILILLSFGVFQFALEVGKPGHGDFSSLNPRSERVEKIVNKHLSLTDQQVKLQTERALFESEELPSVGDRLWPSAQKSPEFSPQHEGVDLSSDPREQVAIDDLDRHHKEYGNYKSPNFVIQNEGYAKEKEAADKQASEELYAQQFIENARRKGYQVRLDSNRVVIDVRKIPTQGSQQLKSPRGSGAE